MSRLLLVLRDLHPARLSDAARAALPRLPHLEQWIAQGASTQTTEDWRAWLQRQTCIAPLDSAPPASVAAAAVPGAPADVPVWLATPLHLVAGLDTVRVHPAGLLPLGDEEQRTLAQDFARVFAGSGWSLHATGRRDLLLAGGADLAAGAVLSHDPGLWLGADPRAGLPSGRGADNLRRLGAEMEMWLHEHPVNRARLARGLLNANALWVWGGGAPRSALAANLAPQATRSAIAWADDLFMDGLARLAGFALAPLPPRWPPAAREGPAPEGDHLAVCEWGAEPGANGLVALERDWIAPALAQWRAGRWHRATLWAGARAVTLMRGPLRSLWRGLRRARPWWENWL